MVPAIPADMVRTIAINLARQNFYAYCRIRMPRVYRKDRPHLKDICDTLEAFYHDRLIGDDGKPVQRLILNAPPRHGKTLTLINFAQWIYGRDPLSSIIDISYNETLSGRYARAVRDGIQEPSVDPSAIVYADVFPKTKVKKGDASYQLWSLEGSHFSFLATSPGATLTGTGTKWMFIDDIIKSAEEAFNQRILDEHWDFYTNTALSRLESGAKQIVLQTRWSTKDLTGKLLAFEPDKWHVIKVRANKRFPELPLSDDDMLCPSILDAETYRDRKGKTDAIIFGSNYDQEPYDSVDRLYGEFKTYSALPDGGRIEAYFDTADTGSDFLSGGAYKIVNGVIYMLDVLHTQAPMEETEIATARLLSANNVDAAWIESNNGGRGFSRNVERILRETGNTRTVIRPFTQTGNKESRILANSSTVTNCIIMPEGWQYKWPVFHQEVTQASRSGKRVHDDSLDFLSGACEKSLSKTFEIW